MKIVEKKISDLTFAEYNPRQLSTEQFENIKASLSEFGFVDPIVVNMNPERKNTIVGGHQRVRVWKELGNKTVPSIEVDLSLEKERELNIRLNACTGEWDWDKLANDFELDDLRGWGFDDNDLLKGLGLDEDPDALDPIQNHPQEYCCPECGKTGVSKEFKK